MVLLVVLLESRECIDDGQLPFILCTSDPDLSMLSVLSW